MPAAPVGERLGVRAGHSSRGGPLQVFRWQVGRWLPTAPRPARCGR